MTCQMPMLMHRGWEVLTAPPVRLFRMLRTVALCWLWGIERGTGSLFAGPVFVRTRKRGSVKIGQNVRFNSTISENALCRGSTVLDTRLGGIIGIGDGSGLSSAALSCKTSIKIGKDVLIGANTQIYDHNFHALAPEDRRDAIRCANVKTASVVIEDDCFIGANCIILKGTCVGAGSLVAAGSVVFGLDIPPHSLVRGNPAQIISRTEK